MPGVTLPPGVARAEPRCPFCMSERYHDPRDAWRADLGPGIALALRHSSTCPRYLRCMGCGGDAITGFYGLCCECWDRFVEEREIP